MAIKMFLMFYLTKHFKHIFITSQMGFSHKVIECGPRPIIGISPNQNIN